MAQAIVQSSIGKLRSAIGDAATLRLNFTGDLQEMLERLVAIDAAIPNAEWMDTYGGEWLPEVRDVACWVSHMVDELQDMTVNKMPKMLHSPDNVVDEPKSKSAVDRMKEIKEWLKELDRMTVWFDDVADKRALLQASPAATVGRDEAVEKILFRLSECPSTQGPIILLIRGEKHIGKTTVAAMVFDHRRFKSYSRIWIDVSTPHNFDLQEVGKYMISQLVSAREEEMSGHGSNDDMQNITNRLHELLNGKKVLLVLHHILGDASKWQGLKDMLTVRGINTGQVTVIAAVHTVYRRRAKEIAGVEGFNLQLFDWTECKTIIKQAALRSQHRSADQEDLQQIASEVAKLCQGVPMAAQIYGSLLQFKPYREWPQLQGPPQPGTSFNGTPAVESSLELSYRSMPPNLRLCFSYCAFVFTTQREIVKDDLIHQWVALDLIEPSEAFSATQLSEQYLRRLLDMSLLQTAKSSRTSAKDDTCAIWFTMHVDVASFKQFHKHGFCLLEEGTAPPRCSYVSVPDLNFEGDLKSIFPDQKLRALRCLGCSRMKLCNDSFSFATCLRALELRNSSGQKLPESICQLRQLGYLKLSGWSGLVTLPESIGDLVNLLHIELLSCSGLVYLPGSFGNLINLVHISLSGCSKLAKLPEPLGKLIKLVHIDLSGSGLVQLPEFFGEMINLVHINLSGCLALVNLPGSFTKLTKLEYINLSGCPKLVNLPDSFGKLTNLVHINLSGCSGLGELPQSFGKLISLLHINLSGCSGLVALPGSFGDLQNLWHVDLSHCHGLLKLPESFGNLKKMVYLDLSFWSCFEGIQTALGGLTNLQHLNLSHPCCYHDDYHQLQGLKEVLSQFIRLKHLNLSMFLNPFFRNQTDVENREYIEFISSFPRLEYLDLSHSIFLRDLPESLARLNRLHTLDLSGCIRLKKVERWVAGMQSLELVVLSNLESYQFTVGTDNPINRYGQLMDVRCNELVIRGLNLIRSAKEPQGIRLSEKKYLQKLKLCWAKRPGGGMEDSALLGELVPPHSLRYLKLHGYAGKCWPAWLTLNISSYNLVEVTIENTWNCSHLPPLGLLPNLQRVVLRRIRDIARIDAHDLSGGNEAAFCRLSSFTMDDMPDLEEFITTYCSGGKEFHFLVNGEFVAKKCHKMSFVPLPPRARRLVISECDEVMICWRNRVQRHGEEGRTCISSTVTQVTELVVENCMVYLSSWCFLNHLPDLRSLTIMKCPHVTWSPHRSSELVRALSISSLKTLCISNCHWMTQLPRELGGLRSLLDLRIEFCYQFTDFPEKLGGLTSLQKLQIKSCHRFKDFPDDMEDLTSLRSLNFTDCRSMGQLPKCLGKLTSLEKLAIERCPYIRSLPESVGELTNLKDLHIVGCEKLKEWCGEEYGKYVLVGIRPKIEDTPTSEKLEEIQEDDSEQSGSESD